MLVSNPNKPMFYRERKLTMETLTTTPHDFMWKIKNPQDYWSDFIEDVKCDVYIHGNKLGTFNGVNRSFDDDYYYLNYWDKDNKFNYQMIHKNTEMILKPIKKGK